MYQNVFYSKVRVQKASEEGKAFRRLFPSIHDLLLDLEAERPQIFLGTIHDALVTTPDQAGYVRRVMTEEFRRVGVTPTIRDK